MNTETSAHTVGFIGLGVMGESLALNLLRHGHAVVGFDASPERREAFKQRTGGQTRVAASLSAVLSVLPSPRLLWLMVPAGQPVDEVIERLKDRLSPGDVVIDGGNSHYDDTERRCRSLANLGVHYLGMGVSGGQEGALRGPAMMPGGHPEAWARVKDWLPQMAAQAPDGHRCCQWMGEGGAGHFVKMVHNGIEYADMQLLGEAYALLQHGLGLSAPQMAEVFEGWNRDWLASYLMDITVDILRRVDDVTGRPLVDLIVDKAEQKGTGRWTSEAALAFGVPTPTLTAAVFARTTSALRNQRLQLAAVLAGPAQPPPPDANWVQTLGQALLAARLATYAQGLDLIHTASLEREWHIPLTTVTSVWRAGCILRGQLLEPLGQALARGNPGHLLLDAELSQVLQSQMPALRSVVRDATAWGVPVPCLSSALTHVDAMRSARLPANLLQAQRDYFGAHTYERLDQPGKFHTEWRALD